MIIYNSMKNPIIRFIEFPPEYHQAGMSILNYFGTVLRKKYPDIDAKVRIEQYGLKVSMIIDPIKGERYIIEQALDEYGLVITGKMLPEDYTDNTLLRMELEGKLNLARAEIENQRLILRYQEKELERKNIQIGHLLNLLRDGLKSESETTKQPEGTRVFISYAEDDMLIADKIYVDLQKKGIAPWVGHKDINAGERTESTIRNAIKDCDYFLVLLSSSSVNERGMFQKELKQAFDILAKHPQDDIFIIPVRLDDCNTNNETLSELHIIDLHKTSWNSGLERIIQAMRQ